MIDIDQYQDVIGRGIVSSVGNQSLKLGSAAFIFGSNKTSSGSAVFIEVNGNYLGQFTFQHALRPGVFSILTNINKDYQIFMLSGDTDDEKDRMLELFGDSGHLHFNQSPKDKLTFVKQLQDQGNRVMMIGDGLNDAGALKQSNVGIVISDDINNFSPACDGILSAKAFISLDMLLGFAKKVRKA